MDKENVFIIYDQVGFSDTDGWHKKIFYQTLEDNAFEFILVTQNELYRPIDLDKVKAKLYGTALSKDKLNVHCLICSGAELGCRYFYDLLHFFNLHENVLFISEDVAYRHGVLRLMKEPIDKNKNLGFSEFADNWFNENFSKNTIANLMKDMDIFKKGKTIKNRISIISQPHCAVTFTPLKAPFIEYPLAIKAFLEEEYKDNFKNLEILWHLHPGEHYKEVIYRTELIGLPVKIMSGPSEEEASSSERVVGWDSTFLIKAFYSGLNTYALKKENVLNFGKDKFLLSSKIEACSFHPSDYKKFLTTKKTYQMLSKPNNPKFCI